MKKDSTYEETKIIHLIQKKIQYMKAECDSSENEINEDT